MGKVIRDDKHDGRCGHCMTQVHPDATVCPSCGAYWGSSKGMSRPEIYQEGKAQIFTGIAAILIMLLIFIVVYFYFPPAILILMLVSAIVGIYAVAALISGIVSVVNIDKITIAWWRST